MRRKKQRKRTSKYKRKLRFLIGELLITALTAFTLAVTVDAYIKEHPGFLERATIKAVERTDESITLKWAEVRNSESVTIVCRKENGEDRTGGGEDGARRKSQIRRVVHGSNGKPPVTAVIDGLEEGTEYSFILMPSSKENEGFATEPRKFRTKSRQAIGAKEYYTKLTCSKKFRIEAPEAKTALTYKSSDESVAAVSRSGEIKCVGAGRAVITITAAESKSYMPASAETEILVIGAEPADPGVASCRLIYDLNESNCSPVRYISGADGAVVPQAFGFTGSQYIVAYGMYGTQRVVTFDADGDAKYVTTPSAAMGHPNGFTYAESTGRCYSVRGWSTQCVTYTPETGEFGSFNLPYMCSGIAYDRVKNVFYTSSRSAMRMYSGDGNFAQEKAVGVVSHSGTVYTQDCGGHAGVMLHCLSGANKHGTGYVDMYDMVNGLYLGSFSTELSEVESAAVDEDGFLLLMSNCSSAEDIIYRTEINIEDIGAGL